MSRGLVAVVTGASSGLGEATARLLVREHGARVLLVARREERLATLSAELGDGVSYLATDLTEDKAPGRVAAAVAERHGRLDLLVNNAGAAWRGDFRDSAWEIVSRTMALNFDAQVRLTDALLPVLRASAPSAIVNVASTAARVAREGSAAYSASKAALALWSEALHYEEARHDVHVGTVLPGFIPTEGFPQKGLPRWVLGTADGAAAAILDVGLHRRAERYVPRAYGAAAALRTLAPGLTRRVVGRAGRRLTPAVPRDDR